ncbi:MAG: protein kinase [Desmonostoc vinosum HA7617-LM4]|nr:protein kinase [Desmonostoc vinosum HA7617-LM4]
MLGQKLGNGRYKIIKQLAEGGFGVTFLAEDTQLYNNKCVIKLLKPKATDEYTLQQARRLFENEGKKLQVLGRHDQIPQLLAYFEEYQDFYLVQEYIEGHELSQELPPFGKSLNEAEVMKILKEILEVLVFVHQNNVIHRDIKPTNILRRKSDQKIVLIDFGAVKEVNGVNQHGQTILTVAIGTPGYMPNEQAAGNPQFNSDVYAVGIMGIQAWTGIYPHPLNDRKLPIDPQTKEILWRQQAQDGSKLADILDIMVRYDCRQRYQSAFEVLQALEERSLSTSKSPVIRENSQEKTTKANSLRSFALFGKILVGLGIAAAIATIILLIRSQKDVLVIEKIYNDAEYRIKIKHPDTWDRQDIDNPITGEVVRFLSPKQSDADKFQDYLTISIESYSGTLEESTNLFINEIKNSLLESKIINTSSTTLANRLGKELVFTGTNQKTSVKNLQVWTLKNDKVYIITYTADINDYDKFFKRVQEMIKSFEIQS